jgi:hypothetical protein
MLPSISKRKRRPPRSSDDTPSLDTQESTDRLHVIDQLMGTVVPHIPVRPRCARAALVDQDDTEAREIEKPERAGRLTSAAGAAMQHYYRKAVRRAGHGEGNPMPVADDMARSGLSRRTCAAARTIDRHIGPKNP